MGRTNRERVERTMSVAADKQMKLEPDGARLFCSAKLDCVLFGSPIRLPHRRFTDHPGARLCNGIKQFSFI